MERAPDGRALMAMPLIIYVMMITLTSNLRPLILEINAGRVRAMTARSRQFEDSACPK
jgi:hypothetical protein